MMMMMVMNFNLDEGRSEQERALNWNLEEADDDDHHRDDKEKATNNNLNQSELLLVSPDLMPFD